MFLSGEIPSLCMGRGENAKAPLGTFPDGAFLCLPLFITDTKMKPC
jgi:hypothetical protein